MYYGGDALRVLTSRAAKLSASASEVGRKRGGREEIEWKDTDTYVLRYAYHTMFFNIKLRYQTTWK